MLYLISVGNPRTNQTYELLILDYKQKLVPISWIYSNNMQGKLSESAKAFTSIKNKEGRCCRFYWVHPYRPMLALQLNVKAR